MLNHKAWVPSWVPTRAISCDGHRPFLANASTIFRVASAVLIALGPAFTLWERVLLRDFYVEVELSRLRINSATLSWSAFSEAFVGVDDVSGFVKLEFDVFSKCRRVSQKAILKSVSCVKSARARRKGAVPCNGDRLQVGRVLNLFARFRSVTICPMLWLRIAILHRGSSNRDRDGATGRAHRK